MPPKLTIVHPFEWFEKDGSIPADPRRRARALRIAQVIEAAALLPRGHARETLLSCKRKPDKLACTGLLWVLKQTDDAIQAFCTVCGQGELLIYDWQRTRFAKGPSQPIDIAQRKRALDREDPDRIDRKLH